MNKIRFAKYIFNDLIENISQIEIGYYRGTEKDVIGNTYEKIEFMTFDKYKSAKKYKKKLDLLSKKVVSLYKTQVLINPKVGSEEYIKYYEELIIKLQKEIKAYLNIDLSEEKFDSLVVKMINFDIYCLDSEPEIIMVRLPSTSDEYKFRTLIHQSRDFLRQIYIKLESTLNEIIFVTTKNLEQESNALLLPKGIKKEAPHPSNFIIDENLKNKWLKMISMADLLSLFIEIEKELEEKPDFVFKKSITMLRSNYNRVRKEKQQGIIRIDEYTYQYNVIRSH